ncbi:hypothetical protein AB0J55_02065 [Amycolatopsis sp. NPDC049688]|uniref:hypothetical protein n=1 Tax=Amycolatopsis sp. NPDC049688 TaxID=3154733 RepID=UPI003424D332
MTDLDQLRRVLHAQEALAPDPDAVLAAATRRIRRRRAAGVAAVTLTVVAVGAGAIGLLERGTAAAPPAAHPAPPAAAAPGAPLPAAPSISLEDGSWQLLMWAVQPHFAGLHYGRDHRYAFEIDVRDGTAPHGALPAKPTAAGQLRDPRSVRWQDGPDRWVWARTTKPVTAVEMLDLLGKIRATPPVVHSPLKSLQVPAGQKVTTFTSEPETNTLVLCPDPETMRAPLDSRCYSLFVTRTERAADSPSPEDPLPLHQHRTIGAYTIEIDSSPSNKAAARELLDSVQLDR